MKYIAKNATSSKNCLTCGLFSLCSYTAKSLDFRCNKFKALEAIIITGKKKKNKKKAAEDAKPKKTTFRKIEGAELPKSELDRLIKSSSDPSARDFRKYLRRLSKSDNIIFSDPRIDDRDFKRAPNFFTWCTGKKFLNQEPYAKQLQLGINFYSEWCPCCSNRDYVADIPIDAKPADILSNVTFFRHGVCPKCGFTKSEAILNNELPQYQDLTAIVGQRGGKCIAGNSWITTSFGLVRMKDLVENKLESVSDEYGHAHNVANFWDKGPKKVYTLHMSTGHSLVCTPEHPLLTLKGWIPAKNLPQNEALPINIRQENLVPSYIWMAWIKGNPHAAASLANFARIEMGSSLDVLAERLYSLGQRTAENFIFDTKVEDWVFESTEKPLHKRELSTAFMCMPLDFYKGFFHTCFFSRYQIDVKVRFHHLSKAILKQLQLLLGNIGFFSRIDAENGLIIEGRQVLELVELTRALVTDTYGTAAHVSQGICNYAEHEAWYDIFPESARRHVQNLIVSYVQDVEKSIQETHGDYSDIVTETGSISKTLEQVRAFSRYCVDEIIREDADRIRVCMQEISVYHTQFAHRLYQAFKEICRKDQAWTELKHINKRNNTASVYDIEVPKTRRFLANGLLVHNSVAVSQIASYALHDYIMIKDPSKYFGIANTILHGTITAHTYAQAKEAVWDPVYDLLTESPWFSRYHEFLTSKGNELGEELFRLKDTFVMYRHRGLQMAPSGPNKKALRGRTRFFSNVDELGWFSEDESKIKASGMEIVKALTRSLQTLRSATRRLIRQGVNDFPMPIMCNISSPSDINDPIMQLSRRAEKPGSRMYCVQYPTWEFNPDITFEDLASEFSDDPDGAWRDFGARPPMSALAFISDIKHFKGIANRNTINAATVQQKIVKTRSQQLMTGATLQWNWTDDSVGKLLCIDPGSVSNSFSFSVSHMDPEIGLVFDLLGEVIPKRDYPINFNHLYKNVLADICYNMNIKAVGGDRWQNLKIIHDLENDFGIDWFEVRLKYSDFLNFREALYQGDFRLPGLEMPTKEIVEITSEGYPRCFLKKPVSHFVYQSLTVQDNAPKSVDKAPGMTDDLFRVVVLAHAMMQDPTVAELLEGQVETPLTGGIAARNTGVAVSSLGDIASRNNASSGNITELGAIGNRTNATSL